MKLYLHRYALALAHPFTISRSSTSVRDILVVELRDGELSGYGEATDNAYYRVTLQGLMDKLRNHQKAIEEAEWDTPDELWTQLAPLVSDTPFAQCALDVAAHDLWGKRNRKPAFALWGLKEPFENLPCTDYTLAMDTPDVVARKLGEFPNWPVYKVKLGRPDDMDLLRALRPLTDAPFYVDANCGWDEAGTLARLPELVELGVTLIEQPLPPNNVESMRRLKAASPLPLIADESCRGEADVSACADTFHGINIKLVKCGGLTPARRMIADARARGMQIMVGCMTESTVGISGAAQLLPLVDYADLDGPLLLARDIARGVRIEGGEIYYSRDTYGCGVTLL